MLTLTASTALRMNRAQLVPNAGDIATGAVREYRMVRAVEANARALRGKEPLVRTTKIATFALLGVIGILGADARAQPAPKGDNMIPAQNMSGADFLALLGRIVGDGDLRNIKRIAGVLGVSLSLEPEFVFENNVERLGRVAVVLKPTPPLFNPPLFRYDFSIQDSAPQSQPYPKLIAVMGFQLFPTDPCITRDGLAQQFGPGFVDKRVIRGPVASLTKQIGTGHDYKTELTADFEPGKDCSNWIVVTQVSHGSCE